MVRTYREQNAPSAASLQSKPTQDLFRVIEHSPPEQRPADDLWTSGDRLTPEAAATTKTSVDSAADEEN